MMDEVGRLVMELDAMILLQTYNKQAMAKLWKLINGAEETANASSDPAQRKRFKAVADAGRRLAERVESRRHHLN